MAFFWVLGKLALIAAAILNIILSKALEDIDAPPEFASNLALTAHIAFIVGVSLETILTACELHHSVRSLLTFFGSLSTCTGSCD